MISKLSVRIGGYEFSAEGEESDVSRNFDDFVCFIKRRKAADDLIAAFTEMVNQAVAQKRHVSMRRVGKKISVSFSEAA